jgi:di/tricarboxylate transporter
MPTSLDPPAEPSAAMWFVLALTAWAMVSFVRERWPLEVTCLAVLVCLLLFGALFPVPGPGGQNLLGERALLSGFSSSALITVLALLVMGQGLIQTDALGPVATAFAKGDHARRAVWGLLALLPIASAILNDTPLVVIAIPLIGALAVAARIPAARVMLPVSYMAVLGGMTTLIGSSTNLLVAGALDRAGAPVPGIFDFFVPGTILAGVGAVYVLGVLPRFLPDRAGLARGLAAGGGREREFLAEIEVVPGSPLVGAEAGPQGFTALQRARARLIRRGPHLLAPPFVGYTLQEGDVLIVSGGREALSEILARYSGHMLHEREEDDSAQTPGSEYILAEIMVAPASRLIDVALENVNLSARFGLTVLGVQRREALLRRRLAATRLEAGDVLLVSGRQSAVNALRGTQDFILVSGSKADLPSVSRGPLALALFACAIGAAIAGLVPIVIAAIAGASAMVATGCLNIRQAARAVDRKIFVLVGSMLALGTAMEATGGAAYVASSLLSLPFVEGPWAIAVLLFGLVALTTNILSNNACAILFTPIAVGLARALAAADPALDEAHLLFVFAVTVIFGANCSFATPIGYQTNLLVMGPGHYKFRDFMAAGAPLVLLLWATYAVLARYYFVL